LELVSAEVCPALVDSALELRASVPATLDTRLTTGAEILTGTHSGAAARRAALRSLPWAEAAVKVAAVNNTAVVAAKIILFEFIANRSVFQSTQKPHGPSTFKSYDLQRFDVRWSFALRRAANQTYECAVADSRNFRGDLTRVATRSPRLQKNVGKSSQSCTGRQCQLFKKG
jgi:hypothetical protein